MEALRRDGVLRRAVLDLLGLVEDNGRELDCRVVVEVAPEKGVRGDDEVGGLDFVPVLMASRSGHDEATLAGGELLAFAMPVLDQGGRRDNQGRFGPNRLVQPRQGKPGQRLEGFAEAHFIGQDSAKAALFQETHPIDAFLLVRAEDVLQTPERLVLHAKVAVATLGLGAPIGRDIEVDAIEGA